MSTLSSPSLGSLIEFLKNIPGGDQKQKAHSTDCPGDPAVRRTPSERTFCVIDSDVEMLVL
jgi:hypothetical protein